MEIYNLSINLITFLFLEKKKVIIMTLLLAKQSKLWNWREEFWTRAKQEPTTYLGRCPTWDPHHWVWSLPSKRAHNFCWPHMTKKQKKVRYWFKIGKKIRNKKKAFVENFWFHESAQNRPSVRVKIHVAPHAHAFHIVLSWHWAHLQPSPVRSATSDP